MSEFWLLLFFVAFILGMLAIDLGIFNRKSHEVQPPEAAIWCAIWVCLAALFNAGIYYFMGTEKGLQFTTGYLIEQILSVDNMFVFVLVMSAFRVPKQHQHRLLFYGVLGALIMRGALIGAGVVLIHQFHWLLYAFGAFLVYTGIHVMVQNEIKDLDPATNPLVRFFSKHFPVIKHFRGGKFFVKEELDGVLRRVATPLFLALLCLEATDAVFALDSIPAIFAITDDPFILFTSNIFAILGLRSLYFLLAHALGRFHLLKYGVGLVLSFVGLKMLTRDVVQLPIAWSLIVVAIIIAASVLLSVITRPSAVEPKEWDS